MIEYDTAFVYFRWPSLLTSVAVVVLHMSIFATMGERHNRRLLESNFDAQQSNRAKSAFLASMSHEIRTPMNGVIGLIEMLEHSDLNDDQRRMLRTVRESSFSLLRIIDDILDTSKIEAGRLELKPAPMDLLALVEGVVETMNSFAADRNVQLRLKFESDLPAWITADPGRLRQIFLNLLSNAVKFSSKHPKRSGVVEIIVTHD
jgi:signal transduction histidine kinase